MSVRDCAFLADAVTPLSWLYVLELIRPLTTSATLPVVVVYLAPTFFCPLTIMEGKWLQPLPVQA